MTPTEITVRPAPNGADVAESRLLAFCSVVFDDVFVVHDLKVVRGIERVFVAMPNRKLATRCPTCYRPNHLRANYCNQCGRKLALLSVHEGVPLTELYADVAHCIDTKYRGTLEAAVLAAYDARIATGVEPCPPPSQPPTPLPLPLPLT